MNRKTIRILMLLLVAMGLGIGEAKAEDNVKYVDADGVEKTQDNVTVLEGSSSATVLPGGWYIVTGNNISYGSGLSFSGDTHLILADGAAMTVNGNGLSSSDDLSFYDQGGANPGKLISSVENSLGCKGISAKCLPSPSHKHYAHSCCTAPYADVTILLCSLCPLDSVR
jgi:hypothetical protein